MPFYVLWPQDIREHSFLMTFKIIDEVRCARKKVFAKDDT